MARLATRGALWAGIAIPVLFGAGTILNYPPPTCDEVSYGDTATSLLTRGIQTSAVTHSITITNPLC
jgi:hypothetical protein